MSKHGRLVHRALPHLTECATDFSRYHPGELRLNQWMVHKAHTEMMHTLNRSRLANNPALPNLGCLTSKIILGMELTSFSLQGYLSLRKDIIMLIPASGLLKTMYKFS